ncbi:hypothetical protein [Nocardiopsis tropica]|uniref:Uncharacterized protein n=1 Tax=Nocardiopsis tropica TaxID=109330 RepID=A0ABU7KZQ1_9ACTN|nr:hypothetical protein [Nocardiopsis umidischolae]MEE2054754.1 hypothetical protein [Nocardiopsis umidischolae]
MTPAMVVLRPGDKVLLTLAEDPEPEQLQQFVADLKSAFSGVDFVVASGVTGIAVQAT